MTNEKPEILGTVTFEGLYKRRTLWEWLARKPRRLQEFGYIRFTESELAAWNSGQATEFRLIRSVSDHNEH